MDRETLIRWGFYAAAAFNIVGITIASQGFSNRLGAIDPLFAPHGCAVVFLWGLAYLSIAHTWKTTPWTSFAFALEKAFFVYTWLAVLIPNASQIGDLVAQNSAWSFFAIYGLGDGAFMLFFAFAGYTAMQSTAR